MSNSLYKFFNSSKTAKIRKLKSFSVKKNAGVSAPWLNFLKERNMLTTFSPTSDGYQVFLDAHTKTWEFRKPPVKFIRRLKLHNTLSLAELQYLNSTGYKGWGVSQKGEILTIFDAVQRNCSIRVIRFTK